MFAQKERQCNDSSCRDSSCNKQQSNLKDINQNSIAASISKHNPNPKLISYEDCDVVRPYVTHETTYKSQYGASYNWEQFGNGDVMITCPTTDESGKKLVPKPYPVQPGFDKIKARMDPNVLYDANTNTYIQKGNGVIDNAQLYFVLNNIVQSIDEKALERLLDQNPSIVNTLYSPDYVNTASLLHLCAVRGARELLEIVVARGAPIDIRTNKQETALHLAARRGIVGTVRYLLEHGAYLHVVDEAGNSAAHFAAQSGSSLVLQMLYEQGLDLNMRNNEGQSVGHVMVLFAMNSSLHFVLKQRLIDPTVKDNNGDNLLDYAIRMGEANQCALILEYYPSLVRSIKPFPKMESLDSFKSRTRVQVAIKVVQHAERANWKRKWSYYLLAFRNFLSVSFSFLLKYCFGYKGALIGGLVIAIDCYLTYHSSHRLRYDRTPSPFLAGAFAAGLFFTSVASLNLIGVSFSQFLFPNSDGMPNLVDATQNASWEFRCYVVGMMVVLWWLYTKLMLRRTKGSNYGEPFTSRVWSIAYDKGRQNRLCLLCYTEASGSDSAKRTKHCRLCETCVADMDHHCLYMLTCVGRHNHRLFILFALVTITCQMSFIFFSLQMLHDLLVPALNSGTPIDVTGVIMQHYLILLCLPPNIISCLWGVTFLRNQIVNISFKQTGYFQNFLSNRLVTPKDRMRNLRDFFAGESVLSNRHEDCMAA